MSAADFIPERPTLPKLRKAAADCRGCHLWQGPIQTVFGEGPADARELDRGLDAAGIERAEVYLTNAVKHFKFEQRGKRRIHKTPTKGEVDACVPWLDTEIKLVRPQALVTLGATAAKALLGSSFRLTRHRGELLDSELAPIVAATIHPSAILRSRDEEARLAEREAFAADLRVVVGALS